MGTGGIIWKQTEKGGLGEAMILNLLYRKGIKIFLDFLFFPGQQLNETNSHKRLFPANLFVFLKQTN